MGCVGSKLEEEEVVTICRLRKRQLKLAVKRRYGLAEAHSRYCLALYAVAASIRLFVARHSSSSSSSTPFLITFPPPPCPSSPSPPQALPPPSENVISNPMFLQQRHSEPTEETIPCESSSSSDESLTSSHSSNEAQREREEEQQQVEGAREREEQVCGYLYMQMPPPMPSPQRDFGWDFFNPFTGVRPEVMSAYNQCSDEDLRAVREQEGIPDLEDEEGDRKEEEKKVVMVEETVNREHGEDGKVVVDDASVNHGEQKGLTVVDIPARGRELLEALKDIEDHFIRAYDSGKNVSRMLEASNRVHLQSGFGEIKGG